MVTIHAVIDKTIIPKLPQESFPGRIVVIQTVESAKKAVEYLSQEPILGIDTETRPSFKKGVFNKVALLQISTHDTCFLFRLNRMGFPNELKHLLADKKQLKVGLSLKDDFLALHKWSKYENGKYVDLQDYVRNFGILDMSLQKLYANLFQKKISKSQRLSNWEADVLAPAQQRYAATDAWACIQIYECLNELRTTGDYTFVPLINEEVLQNQVIREMFNQQTEY